MTTHQPNLPSTKITYLEDRLIEPNQLASDIANHWQARQRLGNALVIAPNPQSLQKQLKQHWQIAIKTLDHKRSHAMSQDEILRLTHQINSLKAVIISADTSQTTQKKSLHCALPQQLTRLNLQQYHSVYLTTSLSLNTSHTLQALPANSMLISYGDYLPPAHGLNLQLRAILDQTLYERWQAIVLHLEQHDIHIENLSQPTAERSEHIYEALDGLFNNRSAQIFLDLASSFKAARELAQPSLASAEQERLYDTLIVLGRHVQAWSPRSWEQHFQTGIDDPMFFLSDRGRRLYNLLHPAQDQWSPIRC